MTLFEVWQAQLGGGEDLRAMLDHIPTPVVCCALGDAVRTLYINWEFERTFGYTLDDIPSAGDWARRAYPDEAYRYSLVTHFHCNDTTGHVEVYGVTRNITKRRQAEEKLRLSEARHRLLAENARDVIWTMAPDGRITYVSPAVQAVRGYTPTEAMQQSIDEIHTPASQAVSLAYFRQLLEDVAAGRKPQNFRGELEYRCRDGSTYWTEVFVYPVLDADGKLEEIVGVSRDIAEHKRYALALLQAKDATESANRALQQANAELHRIATTDALTGAWNRRHFQQLLEVEMASSARHGSALSLLMFDVDHFKTVNDSHGHQVGDQVLVRISELTQQHLRTEDALARWGGEEFVVLLPHCTAAEASCLAERLRALVEACPMPAVGQVTACYGVAQWQPGETPDQWFKRLDQSLYRAKAAGRNRVELAGWETS